MTLVAPQFSIVIPTYNRAHLIGKTLDSVLLSDFKDYEILVIDDGSKDDTEAVIEKFTDPRIQYFKKENAERGAARNYGAARAKGRYINFFDSDDIMYANHLAAANALIAKTGSPEFFHLGYDHRSGDGTVESFNQFDDSLPGIVLFDNKLSCNGVFLRRDIALKFPFEEERALASSEDWELWIRLICRFTLHYSNEITSAVIGHDQRSLLTILPDKVVARDLLFIQKLHEDKVVMKHYGKSFKRFIAERFTFFMLCFAEQGRRSDVLKWGIRALRIHPVILMSKRFLASIKNIIIP